MDGAAAGDAVQATAYLAAACRAAEQHRPRPRLRDALAERFLPAGGEQLPYQGLLAAGGNEVVARTVLIDRLLAEFSAAAGAPVVVNLGAGFCTRPYRLDLSACPLLLELDAAPVLARKAEVLAGVPSSCPVRRVPVDLRDRQRLAAVLAEHCGGAGQVVVVSEGVLVYLPAGEVAALAGTLAESLPGPVWLADLVSVPSAQQMTRLASGAGAPLELFGLATLAPFEQAGWRAVDYRLLPVPRRGVPGASSPHPPPQQHSHQVVDGVAALRRAHS